MTILYDDPEKQRLYDELEALKKKNPVRHNIALVDIEIRNGCPEIIVNPSAYITVRDYDVENDTDTDLTKDKHGYLCYKSVYGPGEVD